MPKRMIIWVTDSRAMQIPNSRSSPGCVRSIVVYTAIAQTQEIILAIAQSRKDRLHAEGYFTMRKKDENSLESMDERKQEALWKKTLG